MKIQSLLHSALLLGTLFASQVVLTAQEGRWQLFTNTWNVLETIETDDHYWSFAQGGIVRFDKDDPADFVKYTNIETGQLLETFSAACLDSAGTIWVGSRSGGLSSFDGVAWRQHQLLSFEGQILRHVAALYTDPDGRVWIAARAVNSGFPEPSVLVVADNEVRVLTNPELHIALMVHRFVKGRDNSTWAVGISLADHRSLFAIRFKSANHLFALPVDGLELNTGNNRVYASVDGEGDFWCGSESGLARLRNDELEHFPAASHGLPDFLSGMAVDNEGDVQVYNGHHYYHLQDTDWQARDKQDLIGSSNRITDMLFEDSGRLWLATLQGVAIIEDDTEDFFSTAEGLPADWIYAIVNTKDEGILCRTANGLGLFDLQSWRIIRNDNEVSSNLIIDFDADDEDNLWSIAGGNGNTFVNSYGNGRWSKFGNEEIGLDDSVQLSHIIHERSGGAWLSHDIGVSHFNGAAWTLHSIEDTLQPYREFRFMLLDEAGLWLTSMSRYPIGETQSGAPIVRPIAQLHFFKDGEWTSYGSAEGLNAGASGLRNLCRDADGNIWTSAWQISPNSEQTPGGLFKIDGNDIQEFDLIRPGYERQELLVNQIACGEDGRVWIAFADWIGSSDGRGSPGGLSVFDGTKFQHLDDEGRLPAEGVLSIDINADNEAFFSMAKFQVALLRDTGVSRITAPFASFPNKMQCRANASLWLSSSAGLARYSKIPTSLNALGGQSAPTLRMRLAPNPLISAESRSLQLRVQTASFAPLTISIRDLRGVMRFQHTEASGPGPAVLRIDLDGLPAGSYIVQARQGKNLAAEMLTIVR